MMSMTIVMDETKIKEQSNLTINETYERLEQIAKQNNISVFDKSNYKAQNSKNSFVDFGKMVLLLRNKSWFLPFVSVWIWDENGDEEDVLAQCEIDSSILVD
ncbi:MAG: hypothetical protein IKY94_07015 [Lachnospiraceae bacterium]|nr:hypothetical protein [Lachnospiraceae bacterium]